MGGFGPPFSPWGMGGYPTPQAMMMNQQMGQSQMSQFQMMGMTGQGQWGQIRDSTRIVDLPDILNGRPPKKKCVCMYCGRPAKPTTEKSCPGCGAWEVEFK